MSKRVGRTKRPLNDEQDGPERDPSSNKEKLTLETPGNRKTDSRIVSRPLSEKEKTTPEPRSTKGGRSGGSRAGLMSRGKNSDRT